LNHCPSCRHIYRGNDDVLRCRILGKPATPDLAESCGRFERDPGADDELMVWFNGAWVLDSDG